MPFLFCGERPSARAKAIGATWRNGRLSGYTLHRALRACGIEPGACRYTNVFVCSTGAISSWSLYRIKQLQTRGLHVVALGRKVARVLSKARVAHLRLVHPAARGRIRLAENYDAHVKEVLHAVIHGRCVLEGPASPDGANGAAGAAAAPPF